MLRRVKVETLGRGVLLPELKFALDTAAPGFESLVSHGHSDHIPWEARHAWATAETTDVLAVRAPTLRVSLLPWNEATRVGAAKVTPYPAGHILGSACLLIETPGGERLLYTGDTKTRAGLTCPQARYPEADILVVESTFGLPIYRFPDLEELQARAVAFANGCISEGTTPVFLGYALGKAQEIVAMLRRGGVPVVAHGAVWNMCQVYERHGVTFEGVTPYAESDLAGGKPQRGASRRALVVPGSFREHPMVLKLDAAIAYCSGWARLSKSRVQTDADVLLPLSDHADFAGLLDIVARVKAKRVYANHGYADVFAHILRKRGVDATALAVGHEEEDVGRGELRREDAR